MRSHATNDQQPNGKTKGGCYEHSRQRTNSRKKLWESARQLAPASHQCASPQEHAQAARRSRRIGFPRQGCQHGLRRRQALGRQRALRLHPRLRRPALACAAQVRLSRMQTRRLYRARLRQPEPHTLHGGRDRCRHRLHRPRRRLVRDPNQSLLQYSQHEAFPGQPSPSLPPREISRRLVPDGLQARRSPGQTQMRKRAMPVRGIAELGSQTLDCRRVAQQGDAKSVIDEPHPSQKARRVGHPSGLVYTPAPCLGHPRLLIGAESLILQACGKRGQTKGGVVYTNGKMLPPHRPRPPVREGLDEKEESCLALRKWVPHH
jgi:hypothetical protein